MKTTVMLMLGLLLSLFSCRDEQVAGTVALPETVPVTETTAMSLFNLPATADFSTVQATEKNNPHARKIKIRTEGTMSFTPGTTDCPAALWARYVGEGHASHLGLFTIEIAYCTDGINPLSPILGVQTAANGDQLFVRGVGGDPSANSLDFSYEGGTGRFENASGFVTLFFQFDYENLTWRNFGEGIISY